MKRLFTVIALSAALGLSTTAFTPSNNDNGNTANTECEASADLSVTASLDEAEVGEGELIGKIVNSSGDNDYDEIMVRVEFIGDNGDLDMYREGSDADIDREIEGDTDIDVDADVDTDVDDVDVDLDADIDRTTELETDVDTDSGLNTTSSSSASSGNVLHSQVFTINEDVEAGEVEDFKVNITPPAGTKMVRTTVVCAD
jgi:hypothetical protein